MSAARLRLRPEPHRLLGRLLLLSIIASGCGPQAGSRTPAARGDQNGTSPAISEQVEPLLSRPDRRASLPGPRELAEAGASPSADMPTKVSTTAPPAPKARSIDLLGLIDLERDGVQGQWTRRGRSLVSPLDKHARIEVPVSRLPEEYRVEAVVRRVQNDDMFGLGLVGGGRRFVIEFDSQYGGRTTTGMGFLDSRHPAENETTWAGQALPHDQAGRLELTVRKTGVDVNVNGKRVIHWRGDFHRLSLAKGWQTPHENSLIVCAWKAGFEIEQLTLTPLDGNEPDEQPALAGPGPAPQPEAGFETVRLADGSTVRIPTWGDTYLAYDFRPALSNNDFRATDQHPHPVADPEIKTVFEHIVEFGWYVSNLRLDLIHRKMYWRKYKGSGPWVLYRANLDGTGFQSILTGLIATVGLEVDPVHEKLYWFQEGSEKAGEETALRRANCDGTDVEVFVPGVLISDGGMSVDVDHNRLYYSAAMGVHTRHIFRVNLDGTGRMSVAENAGGWAMWHNPRTSELFWIPANGSNCIMKCNDQGQGRTQFFKLGKEGSMIGGGVGGFYIDEVGERVTFDGGGEYLRRARLDGTQVEELVSDYHGSIQMDAEKGDIYWLEWVCPVNCGEHLGRIRKCKIREYPTPVRKPSPPSIDAIEPFQGPPGTHITIKGHGFQSATHLKFLGLGTGAHKSVPFRIVNDSRIETTVPELPESRGATVAVEGPGGVAVALPLEVQVARLDSNESNPMSFEKLRAPKDVIWMEPPLMFVALEKSIALVRDGANVGNSLGGSNCLFIQNGAGVSSHATPRSLIYHEPFAIVEFRHRAPDSVEFRPVSAIRPCFVNQLFTYIGVGQEN